MCASWRWLPRIRVVYEGAFGKRELARRPMTLDTVVWIA
jgi:hypothetical protein